MPPKKKGSFQKHTNRVGSRFGVRAKQFVAKARANAYDHVQLTKDLSASVMDVAEFWGGLFGMQGSPTAPLLDLGTNPVATWQGVNGVTTTVVVEDPVPEDAQFPIPANPPVLKLAKLGAGPSSIALVTATAEDEESLQLSVTFRDGTGGALASGEYYGILSYTSASNPGGPYFACLVRGIVVP